MDLSILFSDLRTIIVFSIGAGVGFYYGKGSQHETAYIVAGLLAGGVVNGIWDYTDEVNSASIVQQ